MKLLSFNFKNVDQNGVDTQILVGVNKDVWENTSITKNQIEDAIVSYVDDVENWKYEDVIEDVLNSFGLDFEYIDAITFFI